MRLSVSLLLLAGVGALGLAIPALGSAAAPPAAPVLSPLQTVGHLGVVTGRFTGTGSPQDIFTVPAGYRVQAQDVWGSTRGYDRDVWVRDSAGNTFKITPTLSTLDGSWDCHDWVLYPGDTLVLQGSGGYEYFWKVIVHPL